MNIWGIHEFLVARRFFMDGGVDLVFVGVADFGLDFEEGVSSMEISSKSSSLGLGVDVFLFIFLGVFLGVLEIKSSERAGIS
jgi:hypothetical protein